MEEKKQVKEFFQALFEGMEGHIEIRTIDCKEEVKQYFYRTTQIDRLIADLTDDNRSHFRDTNIYFGVCPRRERKGKEENVRQLNTLWVDLDYATRKEKLTALKRLESFEFLPSITVSSGHGLHCYWLLNEPYLIENSKNRLCAKGYLKGLALALNADSTFDLPRILRVPGTKNLKDPSNPLPVEVLEFHPDRRYKLSDFKQYKADIEDVAISVDVSPDQIPGRFWRVLEDDEKLKATWEGKRSDLKDKTRSGFDFALANLLMPHNFSDGEIAGILRASPSGKGKETTPQYLALTVGKARKSWNERKPLSTQGVKDRSRNVVETIDQPRLDMLLERAIPSEGFLKKYVDIFSGITDTPRPFLFWGAMVTLCTVLGKRAWVLWEARNLYPNIWCVFLAPSGFRKSTGIDIPTLLLRIVDESLLLPQVGSEEGLTKALDRELGQDTGFVRWQEFSKILRSWSNKQSWQASQEFWIDLWDNKPLRKKLSEREFNIPTTSISFLSASTPKTFANYFTPQDLDGGFLGRIYLISCLEKKKYFPIPPSIEEKGGLDELVAELHKIKESFTGRLSYALIEERFVSWATKTQKNRKQGYLDSFFSRIETHAMKLAMLYEAALTQRDKIQEKSFDYATSALEFLTASANPLISEEIGISEMEKMIRQVYDFIGKNKSVDKRDVMRKFHLTSDTLRLVESTLEDRGQIEKVEETSKSGRGRRRVTYCVTT